MTDPNLGDPKEVRRRISNGEITGNTSALCPGYAQANLVILPKDWAFDFLLFALRNPKPCPLLEILDPGQPLTSQIAAGADVRKELPRYRVWRNGELVNEPNDISDLWQDDLVSFFLGCSFSFDDALIKAGLPVRHIQQNRNVPMYITSVKNQQASRLGGPLVVSMRPMPNNLVDKAAEVSDRFGGAHGAPVHRGDPGQIGIKDINNPEFGDPVDINPDETPVFWACGVTPQAALMDAKPPFAITHAPGCMFISDIPADDIDAHGMGNWG